MQIARRACGKAMIQVGETRAGLISSIRAPDKRSSYHHGTGAATLRSRCARPLGRATRAGGLIRCGKKAS